MQIKRVMVAAPKSGSGKTVVTCALLLALKGNGCKAASFKCGPDYIDPMFHEKVLNIPSKNLDTFFTDEEMTRTLFVNSSKGKDIAVIEGVMGLYDGLGGIREEGSSYHLAKVTRTPVVLVMDVKGMGRSILPLLAGFLAYDTEKLIQGVILNRISKGYYGTIKPLIEKELKIKVAGFLPEKEGLHIGGRHLGLLLPDEVDGLKESLRAAAGLFSQTVSMESIIKIAESASDLENGRAAGLLCGKDICKDMPGADFGTGQVSRGEEAGGNRPVVAVAKDDAFCFYYADNIRMLEEYGAKIKYFSPLWDEKLPEPCHALLIGGGYPELYAKQLSQNFVMRRLIKKAVESKMPVVAECGGFLYLHSMLEDKDGACYEMAGAIPGTCYDTGKLVRFGYIALREKQSHFLPGGGMVKGHEFHYYDSTNNGKDVIAHKPVTGKEYACVIENEMQWMGFPHLYYPSNPAFVKSFVKKAKRFCKMEAKREK